MQLNKLNQKYYSLVFGPQNFPPMYHKMSKNIIHLNYRQYKKRLKDTSYMALKLLTVEEQCPAVAEILVGPIANYITLSTNNCGYSGTEKCFIVNYFYPLFLKSKSASSREDNHN